MSNPFTHRRRLTRKRARLRRIEVKWDLLIPGSRPWPWYVLDHPDYRVWLDAERPDDRAFLEAHPELAP